MDRLGRLLEHAKRHPDFQVVVMFLDIDRFKVINDSLGHHAGDELLVETARRLDGCLRSTDTVARIAADRAPREDLMTGSTLGRMGGDEFVVVLGGLRQVEGAGKVADRLHGAFSQGFRVRGHEVFVSLSIGIALCNDGNSTPDDLLREADTAMYRAKGLGPSRTEIFSPDMRTEARARLQTDTDLRHALGRNEFELWYQPIVSLESGKVNTVEALLRWRHPTRGFISTQQFIATAESTGLIVPVGYWVLERACADVRRWEVVDPRSSEVFVGVNLSAKQLVVPDLVARVEEIVGQAGVRPGRIEFELTESSVMVDPELAQRQLEALKRKGFRLSIDDFGTGHSSLSYVHRFPVDRIKVDRSFLLRARTEHETDVVMRAIIDLGSAAGPRSRGRGRRDRRGAGEAPGHRLQARSGISLRAAARQRQRAAALPRPGAGRLPRTDAPGPVNNLKALGFGLWALGMAGQRPFTLTWPKAPRRPSKSGSSLLRSAAAARSANSSISCSDARVAYPERSINALNRRRSTEPRVEAFLTYQHKRSAACTDRAILGCE